MFNNIDLSIINCISLNIFSFLLNISIKGILIILLIFIVFHFNKKINPNIKHLLIFLSILSFIIIPFFMYFIDNFVFKIFNYIGLNHNTVRSIPVINMLGKEVLNIKTSASKINSIADNNILIKTHWTVIILSIWFFVFLILFLKIIFNKILLHKLLIKSIKIKDDFILNVFDKLIIKLNIKRKIKLLYTSFYSVPITFKLFNPVIILPFDYKLWDQKRVEIVLLHELQHIKRLDYLSLNISALISSIFWFIPFIWNVFKLQKIEQENACDYNVVKNGIKASFYAEELVNLSRSCKNRLLFAGMSFSFIKKSVLEKRIMNILNFKMFNLNKLNRLLLLLFICFLIIIFINFISIKNDDSIFIYNIKDYIYQRKQVSLNSLPYSIRNKLKETPVLWPVFDGKGDLVPVKYSECTPCIIGAQIKSKTCALVIAVNDGILTKIINLYDCCVMIEITHDNGYKTIYKNLFITKIRKIGTKIKQGEILGFISKDINNRKEYSFQYEIYKGSDIIDPRSMLYKLNGRVYLKNN